MEAEQIWPLRWSQKQRLEFIEFRLQWEGRVNRSDLINFFAISVPQASLDLAKYRELAPNNAVYDATEKTYIAGSSFAPVLVSNSAETYLNQILAAESGHLGANPTFLGSRPATGIVQAPSRTLDPVVLRVTLQAIREHRTVEISYQSMSKTDPTRERSRRMRLDSTDSAGMPGRSAISIRIIGISFWRVSLRFVRRRFPTSIPQPTKTGITMSKRLSFRAQDSPIRSGK